MHLLPFGSLLGPDTSWLLTTDALLGLFTLLCLAAVAVAIVRAMIGRLGARGRALFHNAHATALTQLGIAITDDEHQPDEKDLHLGRIPSKKGKDTTHIP